VTLSLNSELISRVTLCMVCVFRDIVKDRPKIRNLCKIFLRSFENVAHRDKYVIVNLMCLIALRADCKNAAQISLSKVPLKT